MQEKLKKFRAEARQWLANNCPTAMRDPPQAFEISYGGRNPTFVNKDAQLWMQRITAKGWSAPTWPTEYGGAGLSHDQAKILQQEMAAINARPALTGHGLWMLGPALLEFGNQEQKQRFIPDIIQGNIRWCQGYSEPGAGSDLANIQTKAEDMGDHYLVNGSKIWTTDADKADWIFCLVRTDPKVKKQAGISFLLIDMQSTGISTSPIELISGEKHFCQTFFDNVKVPKDQLVGEINKGWTIAKALLVHERKMMSDLQAFTPKPSYSIQSLAAEHLQTDNDSYLLRQRIASWQINQQALNATQRRLFDESKAGLASATGLIMKYYGTELLVEESTLALDLLSHSGLGWNPESQDNAQKISSQFLRSKGVLLGGGSSEIQLNIIAKHGLGLPD